MKQAQALRYFAEVARTGSLRQASDVFFVAPSAISRQIANLEKELGTDLFERTSRGMVLTDVGQLVLDFVAESGVRIDRLRSDINDLDGLRRGTVRLAVVEAVASDFLPGLLTEFASAHPGIDFRVSVCGSHQVADRVSSDAAEIGLTFNTVSCEDLTLQGRIDQPLQMICRAGHRLAARASVSMTDLDGVRVALPDRSFGIRSLIDQAAARAGVSLSVAYEANSLQLIKAVVSSADLVSFMPPLTFAREHATGILQGVDLSDQACGSTTIDIVTARHRKLSVAAAAVLAKLRQRDHKR